MNTYLIAYIFLNLSVCLFLILWWFGQKILGQKKKKDTRPAYSTCCPEAATSRLELLSANTQANTTRNGKGFCFVFLFIYLEEDTVNILFISLSVLVLCDLHLPLFSTFPRHNFHLFIIFIHSDFIICIWSFSVYVQTYKHVHTFCLWGHHYVEKISHKDP